MERIDLETKSKELKEFVSQFETKTFLGEISSLMNFIRFNNPINTLNGLSSPQRQLYYLAALNVTSNLDSSKILKKKFNNSEFDHIKKYLIEIENGYNQFFFPKSKELFENDWVQKCAVSMPTFLSYFNQGQLNYEEQILERISSYFGIFDTEIFNHFGLTVNDFIAIYNFIDSLPNQYLKDNINKKKNQESWEEFSKKMLDQNIPPSEWIENMVHSQKDFYQFMDDKGILYRFSKTVLVEEFGETKADSFLKNLTCIREESDFIYYTEPNILHSKPIFELGEGEYQAIEIKQIIHSIYNILFDFCVSNERIVERFYKKRGKMLEEKIVNIFQRFFKGKAVVHEGFYTKDKHEQDILILYEGLALIIEAKASKRDEPKRNPDIAYPEILRNFEETIQKGYDQSYRVKSKFIKREVLNIFKDQSLNKHIIDIHTKNYHNVFSLVVTLERFGQIQSDLFDLLEIWEDDDYPWSVCIDDLEVFLLQCSKMGKKKKDLIEFLNLRESLHGRLITSDELEVCGAFLNKEISRKSISTDKVFTMTPDQADIFDIQYQTKGLGFDNEKILELKTSGNYIPIGGF